MSINLGKKRVNTVTIAASGQTSTAFECNETLPVALIMPAALTGTSMTFTGSVDGSTFTALNDEAGNAISATIAASKIISLGNLSKHFMGLTHIKFVSGSAEAAARTITVVGRYV